MQRDILEKIRDYFANIQSTDGNVSLLLNELNNKLECHDIAFVNKEALERHGYDIREVDDDDLSEIACLMGNYYIGSRFSYDLMTACYELGIPRIRHFYKQ